MWSIFGRKPRRRPTVDIAAAAERTRLERGKLASAIVELGQKRHHLEELMLRMLEERRNA